MADHGRPIRHPPSATHSQARHTALHTCICTAAPPGKPEIRLESIPSHPLNHHKFRRCDPDQSFDGTGGKYCSVNNQGHPETGQAWVFAAALAAARRLAVHVPSPDTGTGHWAQGTNTPCTEHANTDTDTDTHTQVVGLKPSVYLPATNLPPVRRLSHATMNHN